MSFQEKNITVSLVNFSLISGYFLLRIFQLSQSGNFDSSHVFRLWGIIIILAVIVTVVLMVLTHIGSTIYQVIKTGDENPKIENIEDERDKLIDLRGTKVTYLVSSIGVLIAMLTFVFGQPPLVMFSLLILSGLVAQIIGDISRLAFYRRGF
ncbi:MAG: hypothetical protein H6636_01690 [Anaerolineales bacterium]|nr:hypothetical protein [Anaerolineales bacterium]